MGAKLLALRRWIRRVGLFTLATTLLVVGGVMLVVGTRLNVAAWNTAGIAVFSTGLTVTVGTLSGREAVLQQYAKDANLRRKTDTYGPLHAELRALRKVLDRARAGDAPYPRQIAVDPIVADPFREVNDRDNSALRVWASFSNTYHAGEFSTHARALFDQEQESARQYNAAMNAAVEATTALLKPHIATAIEDLVNSPAYRKARAIQEQLHQAVSTQLSTSLPPDRSFIAWLVTELSRPENSAHSLADGWAKGWSNYWLTSVAEMPTVGWLLARQPHRAAESVEGGFRSGLSACNPPPSNWIESIMQKTGTDLEATATAAQVRKALNVFHLDVQKGECMIEGGLQTIRDRYEGGEPLV